MKVNPQYLLIAEDIARKIQNGTYKVGTMLKGRTLLSGEYKVSSETIRKAINVLEVEQIVTVKRGVGIFVESKDRVDIFLDKISNLSDTKSEMVKLKELLAKRDEMNKEINDAIKDLSKMHNLSNNDKLYFEEIIIKDDCWVINQTIGDVYFYNYTEATIVAVKRGNKLITSPGPEFTFIAGDKLVIIGKDDLSYQRAITYLTYGVD